MDTSHTTPVELNKICRDTETYYTRSLIPYHESLHSDRTPGRRKIVVNTIGNIPRACHNGEPERMDRVLESTGMNQVIGVRCFSPFA